MHKVGHASCVCKVLWRLKCGCVFLLCGDLCQVRWSKLVDRTYFQPSDIWNVRWRIRIEQMLCWSRFLIWMCVLEGVDVSIGMRVHWSVALHVCVSMCQGCVGLLLLIPSACVIVLAYVSQCSAMFVVYCLCATKTPKRRSAKTSLT